MSGPTVYVFCPDIAHPMGGVRMLYRHVDILNANGFEAAIIHSSVDGNKRGGFAARTTLPIPGNETLSAHEDDPQPATGAECVVNPRLARIAQAVAPLILPPPDAISGI